jgi:hypothetical protein
MTERGVSASFHLVCSDAPRNGKTLYARLLADYLVLCERVPLIFDAALGEGGIFRYFLLRTRQVDLSAASGQMAVFDRALERPLKDCVVDLPAHRLRETARVMRDIDFAAAARERGLGVVVHFLADRALGSLIAGRGVRSEIDPNRLIIVRNEAIVPKFIEPVARRRYDELAREGEVIIPALDPRIMTAVEEEAFSFSGFAQEIGRKVPYFTREEITPFLARVYRQFDELALASEFADMRESRRLHESPL